MTAGAPQSWSRLGQTPYVHWRADRAGTDDGAPLRGPLPPPLADAVRRDFDVPLSLALPERCLNPGFAEAASWLPDAEGVLPPPPEPGTPILGIVDTGLPLSHRALRCERGSRILAAWQQGAPWRGAGGADGQPWIPFGHELWRPQIDALLAGHARGPGRFDVDEEGLNLAARLTDMRRADGERELMRARAHGAGVAGLAAAPGAGGEAGASLPLVLVNLPGREALGTAGGFLDLFVLAGLHRIAAIADHLWARLPETVRQGAAVQGYPIAVNLSFGREAGGRHGGDGLARGLEALNAARRSDGRSKVHLVLPAGNGNLFDGHAALDIPAGGEASLDWRLPPEDATCNFLEIWSQPLDGDGARGPLALSVSLAGPDGTAVGPLSLAHGEYAGIAPGIRVYAEAAPVGGSPARHAVRLVLCTEPSAPYEVGAPSVRSGRWRLTLGAGAVPLRVGLAVQTDLPPRRGSAVARRATLSDPRYRRHDPDTGRVLDSHPYPWDGRPDVGARTGVQRLGTINAYAHVPGAVVVAGHRASDGRPAPYSGAGGPRPEDPGPTVSLPSERAPGAPGVLVPGSADGVRHPRSGTSFSSAMAARLAASLLRDRPGFGVDLGSEFTAMGEAAEAAPPPGHGRAHRDKIGSGRIAASGWAGPA